MKILLITGPAGAIQGWGNLETTRHICKAISDSGNDAEILYVESTKGLVTSLNQKYFDMVWSSLYYISDNSNYIGLTTEEPWLADIFDEKNIPYIGPSASTLKQLIDKSSTLDILSKAGIPCSNQHFINGKEISLACYPMFVKPRYESESTGISERCIVCSESDLKRQINYIQETFKQPALVEEFLSGQEFTVTVLGNGNNKHIFPILNLIDESGYDTYPLITEDLKLRKLIHFQVPECKLTEAKTLADKAAEALKCYDHVRIDMRQNDAGELKIMEINGIPGLNPIKSRSLEACALYNPDISKSQNFQALINTIVDSAAERYGLIAAASNALAASRRVCLPSLRAE